MRLQRFEDMQMTGKRHPFYIEYDVGFDDNGRLQGIQLDLAGNCGYSPDLSASIVDRAMFHADNAYYLGEATINGHRCKTHTASNTAYRGFGGPQGMVAIEEVMDCIARFLGKDPLAVRKANYYGKTERNITHYYQTVEHNLLEEMTADLEQSSQYAERREHPGFQRQQPDPEKRPGADAGQIRHLVHRQLSQSGGGADSYLHRWQHPPEPRRHRDGPGFEHQSRASCG